MELFANNIKLPFNGSLLLKFFNPMFNDIGSYSIPVSFPAKSATVQRAFGFPGNIESEKSIPIQARIRLEDIELMGEWKVTDVTSSSIEANFIGGYGNFNNAISGKYLIDLTFNGITNPAGLGASRAEVLTHLTTKIGAVYPDADYTAFCAYMPYALGDTTSTDMKFVNPISWLNNTKAFIIPPSGRLNSSVYLFAGTVIDYIFSEFGYRVEKNIFREDYDLKQLVLFNTFNQNAHWEFNYQNFVPKRTIKDFLSKIALRFNINFIINEETRSVAIEKFDSIATKIDNSNLKLVSKKTNLNSIKGLKLTSEPTDPWTDNAYTRISEFPGDYSTVTEVSCFRNIVPGAGTVNKIYYVLNEDAYYVVKAVEAAYEVQRICTDKLPYYAGTETEERGPAAGFPGMYNYRNSFSYQYLGVDYTATADWMLPRCDLGCNFKESNYEWLTRDPLDYIDFPIMFVYSRGIQNVDIYEDAEIGDPEATRKLRINMPFGTISAYDATGTLIYPYTSLNWNGVYGIVNRLWANRIYWELYQKKVVTADIYGSDIVKLFNFTRAINIEKSNYLVNTFELEITNNLKRIRNAELYRL